MQKNNKIYITNNIINNFRLLKSCISLYWNDIYYFNFIFGLFNLSKKGKFLLFDLGVKFSKKKNKLYLDKVELYVDINFFLFLYERNSFFKKRIPYEIYQYFKDKSLNIDINNFVISLDIQLNIFNNDFKYVGIDYYEEERDKYSKIDNVFTIFSKDIIKKKSNYLYYINNLFNKDKINFYFDTSFKSFDRNINFGEVVFCFKQKGNFIIYDGLPLYEFKKLLEKYLNINILFNNNSLDHYGFGYLFNRKEFAIFLINN